MFGIFTKKNKQAELDREIKEVLEVLYNIRPTSNGDNRTNLEKEIDNVLKAMRGKSPESEEYSKMIGHLETLCKAKANDKSRLDEYTEMTENLERLYKAKASVNIQNQIPWKEIVVGGWGLVQILAIIRHEDVNVITSKAMGWVVKGRV